MIKFPLYFLLLNLILINTSILGQNYWYKLNSPTSNDLNALHFADSLKGWVAGDSGLVLYTTNGGSSWVQQQTNTDRNIIDIFFIDDSTGWAIAWTEGTLPFATFILKTTDAGNNWSVSQFRQENVLMFSVFFVDTLRGFLGGTPGGIFITTDGGENWDSAYIAPAPYAFVPVHNFKFYDNNYGFACGGAHDIVGITWKTIDGGAFWETMNSIYAPPDEIWDIHFFDSLHVLGIGGDPDLFGVGVMRTTDAGLTWTYFEIGLIGIARAVSFRTENEGWAPVPSPRALIQTKDFGYNWIVHTAPDSSSIYDISFTDSLTGFGVGDLGVILKYKYPIVDSFGEEELSKPETFVLFQNYPNPFNSSTTISYYNPEPGNVSLSVYNLLGNQVFDIIAEHKSSGTYNVVWNAGNEASGVYYFRLNVKGKLYTKKMLLLK